MGILSTFLHNYSCVSSKGGDGDTGVRNELCFCLIVHQASSPCDEKLANVQFSCRTPNSGGNKLVIERSENIMKQSESSDQ